MRAALTEIYDSAVGKDEMERPPVTAELESVDLGIERRRRVNPPARFVTRRRPVCGHLIAGLAAAERARVWKRIETTLAARRGSGQVLSHLQELHATARKPWPRMPECLSPLSGRIVATPRRQTPSSPVARVVVGRGEDPLAPAEAARWRAALGARLSVLYGRRPVRVVSLEGENAPAPPAVRPEATLAAVQAPRLPIEPCWRSIAPMSPRSPTSELSGRAISQGTGDQVERRRDAQVRNLLLLHQRVGGTDARDPTDRGALVAPLAEATGCPLECFYWMLGPFDGFFIYDAPDAATAGAFIQGVAASGSASRLETHQLLSMEEAVTMQRKAKAVAEGYVRPGSSG